jgi:Family of unknown function (DUF5681)
MSNSEDNRDLGNKMDQDVPYAVGHKKPPLHTRFPPGQSGNPKGRPKGRSKDKELVNLGNLVMKEPAALHAWLKAKNSASVISPGAMANSRSTPPVTWPEIGTLQGSDLHVSLT